ncbi:lipase ROG1 family protein [Aspergillus puulaauensis]|uniref:DUF676 domain-containing protein n=1 Tax=Aspergillus puulaauensis TaxID=1220207 RepID=A0A7R7XL74_9EURO|nr:uncharacterized protein APUU_31766S [Aspergillus puulaauensis]BCS23541.1 hypothetical protein APUU_31766S [Aspergillus puulaauensis]
MKSIFNALRAQYPAHRLHILNSKRNTGSLTYDGIDVCAERLVLEIEEELESIRNRGGSVTKLSVVGYSIGGLVARYAVGLLESRGIFIDLDPMTFTTFATPHLGVRSPFAGWHHQAWNALGARVLSESGRQLFTVDSFRGSGRPLLSILADPDSVFMTGLAKFNRRVLYANIINDLQAAYYSAAITKTDVTPGQRKYFSGKEATGGISCWKASIWAYFESAPVDLFIVVTIPIAVLFLLCNAVVQSIWGYFRIRNHQQLYINAFLPVDIKRSRHDGCSDTGRIHGSRMRLTPSQLSMISALNEVGWHKYPVCIHRDKRSHAAIIARTDIARFAEGHLVLKHWVEEGLLI